MFAALNSFLTRAVTGYFLNKSLRFRSSASAYLNRTFAAGNRTTWTWSSWIKRGKLGAGGVLFQGYSSIADRSAFQFNSSDQLFFNGIVGILTTAVFRDPAAWYHMVCVYDSTNATDSNRIILYVNGVRQTVTGTYPPASQAEFINGAWLHYLSTGYSGAFEYTDGELAEVNFVDGQALSPTAFGASSIYNQWLPIKYAGTYGTNGFYLPFSATSATSYAGSFNGSTQYLAYPNNAAFSFGSSNFTIEAWIKVTSTSNYNIYVNSDTSNNLGVTLYAGGGTIHVFVTASPGGNIVYDLQGPASSVVTGVWTHIAFVRSGTTFTAYVNGVAGTPSTNSNAMPPSQARCFIGTAFNFSAGFFSGDISNYRVVNGTAVYTANFVPPTAALTAITNTSLLTLQNATIVDNSTNAFTITNTGTVVTSVQSPFLNPTVLTADSSGNANNWTPNNISLTAGSTYDSLTDVPTLTSATVANYAVLNPLTLSYGTLSEANLKYVGNAANHDMIVATLAQSTGKWYFETTLTSNISMSGVVNLNSYTPRTSPTYPGGNAASWGYYPDPAVPGIYNNNIKTDVVAAATNGDIVGIALDCDAGTISWYKNNSLLITKTIGAGNWGFVVGHLGANCVVNFGQQPFVYTAPSGFLPLNTFNI
jgi:hypothetical protein